MAERNPIVFLDVTAGEEKLGRVIIELFKDIVPKTAENFRVLCVGEHIGTSGKPLHYKGSVFHRIIPQFMIQGGDIINLDGTGGESIYGPSFQDENHTLKHDSPGILSTVKNDQSSSNSQFFITTTDCPHLDGTSVVFGKVIKGMNCVFQISEVKTADDVPLETCIIENCGEIKDGELWNYADVDDNLPPDPVDSAVDIHSLHEQDVVSIVVTIKQCGNYFFSKENHIEAHRKYKKALRYLHWLQNGSLKCAEPVQKELEREKWSIKLNMASTYLKKGLYRESLNECDQILAVDKKNAKAWFRRGKALMLLNDYEGALGAYKVAQSISPHDKYIAAEIAKVDAAKKYYLTEEKKVFSKMFHAYK